MNKDQIRNVVEIASQAFVKERVQKSLFNEMGHPLSNREKEIAFGAFSIGFMECIVSMVEGDLQITSIQIDDPNSINEYESDDDIKLRNRGDLND